MILADVPRCVLVQSVYKDIFIVYRPIPSITLTVGTILTVIVVYYYYGEYSNEYPPMQILDKAFRAIHYSHFFIISWLLVYHRNLAYCSLAAVFSSSFNHIYTTCHTFAFKVASIPMV